jgi:hypothetical protein
MQTLLIDDKRTLDVTRIVRNYNDGIAALQERQWDVLYLDHDLGDFTGPNGSERNGYHIVCFLEANPEFLPKRIEVVSSNPVGRSNIAAVLGKFYPEWRRW